jgi:hypothetical protein
LINDILKLQALNICKSSSSKSHITGIGYTYRTSPITGIGYTYKTSPITGIGYTYKTSPITGIGNTYKTTTSRSPITGIGKIIPVFIVFSMPVIKK